jgi:AraC family transcriptional regulator
MQQSYYLQRINGVIDYIDENIGKKISLSDCAYHAMLSKFHFHRIFKDTTGETLNTYIKRLKMEKAHKLILQDDSIAIKELSINLGYCSTANFSRDFHNFFGYSPTKAKHSPRKSIERIVFSDIAQQIIFKGIQSLPDQFAMCKKITAGYHPEIIQPVFEELQRYASKGSLTINQFIGIRYDDPEYTHNDKCKYDACLAINKLEARISNTPYIIKTLQGGKYAVFSFEGTKEQLLPAWDYISKEWITNNNYQPDDRPHRDIYLLSNHKDLELLKAKLCLAVK